MNQTMILPSSYALIDNEEMVYLDGGAWSGAMFVQNLKDLPYVAAVKAKQAVIGLLNEMRTPLFWGAVAITAGFIFLSKGDYGGKKDSDTFK